MTPRDRVINSIEHEIPDRIPLDGWFGDPTWRKLREHFKVDENESVMKALGLDIRTVVMDPPTGLKPTRVYVAPDSTKDNVSWLMTTFEEWGIGTKAGATGLFYQFDHHPLEHMGLDELKFPNLDAPGRFDAARDYIKKLDGQYAVGAYLLGTMFEQAWWLRGYRTFLRDLYTNPEFANDLLDRLLEWKTEQALRFVEIGVDIVMLGDDWGTQTGLLIPPKMWREYFKERYRKLFTSLKRAGNVHIFFHTCGKIEPLIPELIEVGVEILNPIQPECNDPGQVKRLYGDQITIHGTISVQETLPFGSLDDVRSEVITRMRTVGDDGTGFILSPSNFVTSEVPVEKLLVLYETARKHGRVE